MWLISAPVSESVFLGLYLQRDAAGREKDRVVSQAADDGTLLYSLLLGFRFRFFVFCCETTRMIIIGATTLGQREPQIITRGSAGGVGGGCEVVH